MILQNVIWLGMLAIVIVSANDSQGLWSWSSNTEQSNGGKQLYAAEGNGYNGASAGGDTNFNETDVVNVDEIIETILSSNRQGRNLDGFDEVYSDPVVQDALQKGDDTQARNLIKDKLCSLGLMQCDNAENIEGKRPFLPPGDLIYARPPNGPYRGPPKPPPSKIIYGPARPMPPGPHGPHGPHGPPGPPGSSNNFGPPRKVGYASAGPIYSNPPFLSGPPPNFQGPVYHSKPPGPVYEGSSPYKFEAFNEHSLGHEEHHELDLGGIHGPPKVAAASNTVNIHHHYHHIDPNAAKPTSVIVNNPVPVPVPVGNALASNDFASHEHHESINTGFNPLTSGYEHQSGSSLSSSGFHSVNGGLGPVNGISSANGVYGSGAKPVFESVNNYENGIGSASLSTFGSNSYGSLGGSGGLSGSGGFGLGGNVQSFGHTATGGYNGNSGSYHANNPGYHKKALNTNSGPNSLNSLSYSQQSSYANGGQYGGQYSGQYNGGGDNYQAYESARQDNFDCVCVSFDQCPARDVFGRKGDLILPLDPRSLGSDIEALNDEQNNGNSTAPNTRITKNVQQDVGDSKDEKVKEKTTIEQTSEEVKSISKREVSEKKSDEISKADGQARQAYNRIPQQCGPRQVCCRRPVKQQYAQPGQCGRRNTQGITGRIKNPVYVDGDSEFGEYPWQIAILKKDPKESVYVCGGTLIDHQHIITAAHCVKTYSSYDLRVRLGEWDVNHDVEFFPYIERDVVSIDVHPEYYAGTLDNDIAILRLNSPVDFANSPHISPACLPDKFSDFTGTRCWTTGWGKDAFGDFGKYQNILKEVDVPIINQQQCQQQLRSTRLGYTFQLNPGFICAGGEEGKDACKGDGGGPMVCERNGIWQLVGVVSWGIGCGQVNVPGVYVRVSYYLDWIQQITQQRF